jgi:serine/threonine protein kinase
MVRELFEAALALPPELRTAAVRDRAGADRRLAEEVLALLGLHRNDSFLATPLDRVPDTELRTDWIGLELGPYRLVRQIAAGGMGIVFEAEQQQPQRRVALKVLRRAWLDSDALRRFRDEAEILGRLRHPGIAQVHAAGTARLPGSPDEIPYIALELVEDARPLPRFAAERGLGWRASVELLLQVCDAVQHGHQRGVIHRDLKPHNVLVDPDGRVRVVDFGIARLIDARPDVPHTLPGILLGTPAYMSPEQLAGDPAAAEARSDGYALGVMLFELVTGSPPFDVRGLSPTEAITALRAQGEPPRPSSRRRGLPPELDWIFARAVERDLDRRYPSVSEFAADLRRLLAGEPVLAGRPSTGYRLRKFAGRHRIGLSATALVLVAILAALLVSLRSRARAIVERDRARQEQRVADSVQRLLRDLLSAASPERQGRDVRVRDLLRDASRELDARTELDPLVAAALNLTLGTTYASLGLERQALPRLAAAHGSFRDEAGPSDRRTVEAGVVLAGSLQALGRWAEAESVASAALSAAAALPASDELRCSASIALAEVEKSQGRQAAARLRLETALHLLRSQGAMAGPAAAAVHTALGALLLDMVDLAAARPHVDRAVEIATAVHGPVHPRTISARHARARLSESLGLRVEAEQELRDVLADAEALLGPEHGGTLATRATLGGLLRRLNRREEAGEVLEVLLEARRTAQGPDHEATLATQSALGLLRLDEHRLAEAEALFRDGLERGRRVFEPADSRLSSALQNLAATCRRQGRLDEALALLREAIALLETHAGPEDLRTVQVRFNLGVVVRSRGEFAEAENLVAGVLAARRRLLGAEHPDTINALHELVRILLLLQRPADAEPLARELLQLRRQRGPDEDDEGWITAAQLLAVVLERLGLVDEPLLLQEEVVAAVEDDGPERAVRTFGIRAGAASFFVKHGRQEAARRLYELNRKALADDPQLGGDRRGELENRMLRMQAEVEGRR